MSSLQEELKRLKDERDRADRLYNDALTALDGAVQRIPDMPHPPPSLDEYQITPMNELWNVVPDVPHPPPALDERQITAINKLWNIVPETPSMGTGWRSRLRTLAWELVSPFFKRQQEFNSAVVHHMDGLKTLAWEVVSPFFKRQQEFNSVIVDHINRNIPVQRETRKAIESTIAVLREQLDALVSFQSRLILYLQQITLYVDTKDRDVGGLIRVLETAVSGVSDEIQMRWESMVARERRYEARAAALTAAHEELRTTVGMTQQAAMTLKREIERLTAVADARRGKRVETTPAAAASAGNAAVSGSDIGSYKYVGFEDEFRGSQETIGQRLTDYLTLFAGASDVLDLGCGRGEFLDLLRQHNVVARGVDINHEMVEVCRARGHDVAETDALSYLRAAPDESLGGLFAAQVVEHLQPDYLMQMLETAYFKLRPGANIVIETINPACWFAYFESYIRDITHVRALHPDTLKYLLLANGFQQVEIRYSAPYPEERKLKPLPADGDLAETFNANVEKLNKLFFTHLDYAAIAKKL